MILTRLILQNFRSYQKADFKFPGNTTLVLGNNGAGKTNLLEAIFLLATGRSFRAERDEQMVLYGQDFGRVEGQIHLGGEESATSEVSIVLTKPKRFFINNVAKRKMDFVGNLRCVLFRPEDIEIVLGSPSIRREYLDCVLEQADREYRRCLLSYQKGLRQRNKLLELIRDGRSQRKQLLFWDELLIKNGNLISAKREEYLNFVNRQLQVRNLKLNYEPSRISPSRLARYAENEIGAAKTLVGPHRDEFRFIYQRTGKLEKDLSRYGSRGEQRVAVLGVKLAELEFLDESIKGAIDRPILLLDDIFSELDHGHRETVLSLLEKQQTIITAADPHLIPSKYASIHRLTLV